MEGDKDLIFLSPQLQIGRLLGFELRPQLTILKLESPHLLLLRLHHLSRCVCVCVCVNYYACTTVSQDCTILQTLIGISSPATGYVLICSMHDSIVRPLLSAQCNARTPPNSEPRPWPFRRGLRVRRKLYPRAHALLEDKTQPVITNHIKQTTSVDIGNESRGSLHVVREPLVAPPPLEALSLQDGYPRYLGQ